MKQETLKLLVSDLAKVVVYDSGNRVYSVWEYPHLEENINWFTEEGNKKNLPFNVAVHDDELLSKRLAGLVKAGVDLTNFAYEIAEVNKPSFLITSLENGANPNIPNLEGELPIDRALARNRNAIAKIIINHPNFNFKSNITQFKNILFYTLRQQKFDLVEDIIDKNPSLILEKDKEKSFLLCASYMLRDFPKIKENSEFNKRIFKIVEKCLAYADSQNFEFSIHEKDNKGDTILSLSPEIANLIKERELEKLNQSLSVNKNNNNKNKI